MKKLIAIASLAAIFTTSSASAKTEGNYVGVDVLKASVKNNYKGDEGYYGKIKDDSIGLGLSYKHAFNYNQIFLAPSVFFDKLGLEAIDSDDGSISLDYRYGAKLDLGYDFTEEFSLYATSGISNVSYKINWPGVAKKNDSQSGYLYGVGASYKFSKDISLNLEYNRQSLDLNTPDNSSIGKAESKLKVMKVGVSYSF